jgi:hypothetical protein
MCELRINPNAFVIRKSVWDTLNGFDEEYQNKQLMALDFGYNALQNGGTVRYMLMVHLVLSIIKISASRPVWF